MTDVHQVLARHLREVVPRTEESTLGGEDHPRRVAEPRLTEGDVELLHHRQGHHVESIGSIEPNGDGVALALAQHIAEFTSHGASSRAPPSYR